MKTNKKTYIDITGISLNGITYYLVTATETYDIEWFGIKIKSQTDVIELPFVFKSLEIAKDFCELKPIIKDVHFFNNSDSGERSSRYYTYNLIMNKKVDAYIVWDDISIYYNRPTFGIREIKPRNVYPIVKGFIKSGSDAKLNPWSAFYTIYDARFEDVKEKLSEVFCIQDKDHYHFELVEK